MKIVIKKVNDEIVTSMEIDSEILEFSYVALIDELFEGNKPDIEVEDTIAEEDKKKIEQMFDEICLVAQSNKDQ